MRWWFEAGTWDYGRVFYFYIPLWVPVFFSLVATAFAWRTDSRHFRRARSGLCVACGYDRTGLAPESPCPECGNAAQPPQT